MDIKVSIAPVTSLTHPCFTGNYVGIDLVVQYGDKQYTVPFLYYPDSGGWTYAGVVIKRLRGKAYWLLPNHKGYQEVNAAIRAWAKAFTYDAAAFKKMRDDGCALRDAEAREFEAKLGISAPSKA
jgi:hypothetical protein